MKVGIVYLLLYKKLLLYCLYKVWAALVIRLFPPSAQATMSPSVPQVNNMERILGVRQLYTQFVQYCLTSVWYVYIMCSIRYWLLSIEKMREINSKYSITFLQFISNDVKIEYAILFLLFSPYRIRIARTAPSVIFYNISLGR